MSRRILGCLLLGLLVTISSAPLAAEAPGEWRSNLHLSASLTSVGSAHTDSYPDAAGLGEVEDQTSWIVGADGQFKRAAGPWSQEHRFSLQYGRVDNEESEDELDSINIFRYNFSRRGFVYSSARVRSTFDTFGYPTKFDGAGGIGYFVFDSDTYGDLEARVGPRWSREWNPSRSGDGYYELMLEYDKTFAAGGQFTSGLESYTPMSTTENYTVRWENKLLAPVSNSLDVEYRFTLYYEDQVGEVATKSVSTVNFVYHLLAE